MKEREDVMMIARYVSSDSSHVRVEYVRIGPWKAIDIHDIGTYWTDNSQIRYIPVVSICTDEYGKYNQSLNGIFVVDLKKIIEKIGEVYGQSDDLAEYLELAVQGKLHVGAEELPSVGTDVSQGYIS